MTNKMRRFINFAFMPIERWAKYMQEHCSADIAEMTVDCHFTAKFYSEIPQTSNTLEKMILDGALIAYKLFLKTSIISKDYTEMAKSLAAQMKLRYKIFHEYAEEFTKIISEINYLKNEIDNITKLEDAVKHLGNTTTNSSQKDYQSVHTVCNPYTQKDYEDMARLQNKKAWDIRPKDLLFNGCPHLDKFGNSTAVPIGAGTYNPDGDRQEVRMRCNLCGEEWNQINAKTAPEHGIDILHNRFLDYINTFKSSNVSINNSDIMRNGIGNMVTLIKQFPGTWHNNINSIIGMEKAASYQPVIPNQSMHTVYNPYTQKDYEDMEKLKNKKTIWDQPRPQSTDLVDLIKGINLPNIRKTYLNKIRNLIRDQNNLIRKVKGQLDIEDLEVLSNHKGAKNIL